MKTYLTLLLLLLAAACGSDTVTTDSGDDLMTTAESGSDAILVQNAHGELELVVEAAALAGEPLDASLVSRDEVDHLAAEGVDPTAVRFFDLSGETTMMKKGKSCPYSGVCPYPSYPNTFMYWYDASYGSPGVVNCYYRLGSYPYTVTITAVSTNGCKDCCPGALPCSVGPHYAMSFTCHN